MARPKSACGAGPADTAGSTPDTRLPATTKNSRGISFIAVAPATSRAAHPAQIHRGNAADDAKDDAGTRKTEQKRGRDQRVGDRRRNAAAGEHARRPDQHAGDEARQRSECGLDIAIGTAARRHTAAGLGEAGHHRRHRDRTEHIGPGRAVAGGQRHGGREREYAGADDAVDNTGGQRPGADAAHQAAVSCCDLGQEGGSERKKEGLLF
jgi:hypothetical protein